MNFVCYAIVLYQKNSYIICSNQRLTIKSSITECSYIAFKVLRNWQNSLWLQTLYNIISNTLWFNETIWRRRNWSTLFTVTGCYLTAPSHCLQQCWIIDSESLWHSPEGIVTGKTEDIYFGYEFENYWFVISPHIPDATTPSLQRTHLHTP